MYGDLGVNRIIEGAQTHTHTIELKSYQGNVAMTRQLIVRFQFHRSATNCGGRYYFWFSESALYIKFRLIS